jgi:hypothetical protein
MEWLPRKFRESLNFRFIALLLTGDIELVDNIRLKQDKQMGEEPGVRADRGLSVSRDVCTP